jgi:hypothetical protein
LVRANKDIRDIVPRLDDFLGDRCHAAIPVHQWQVSGEYKQCGNYGIYSDYCRIHRDIVRQETGPQRSWWRKMIRI